MARTQETEDVVMQHRLAQIIDDIIWPLSEWNGDRLNASSAAGKAAAAVLEALKPERQSLSDRINVLESYIAVAKALIGCGQGDHPDATVRESNINQAWHALDASLRTTHRDT